MMIRPDNKRSRARRRFVIKYSNFFPMVADPTGQSRWTSPAHLAMRQSLSNGTASLQSAVLKYTFAA